MQRRWRWGGGDSATEIKESTGEIQKQRIRRQCRNSEKEESESRGEVLNQ